MISSIFKSLILVSLAVVYSHAIFGIGGQYSPNFAASIESSKGTIAGASGQPNLSLDQGSATGLFGFGAKFWIDIIPIVDLELTSNVQFTRYDAGISLNGTGATDTTINLQVETGLPAFSKAKPVFGKISTDISILYPFLELPPVVKMIKLYAGAGVTHVISVEILDKEFAEEAVKNKGIDPSTAKAGEDAAKAIADALKDEGLNMGIGGHIVAGAKLKPPVVPIAIFVNGKIHFGGGLPDAVSSGFTLEMGAALAF